MRLYLDWPSHDFSEEEWPCYDRNTEARDWISSSDILESRKSHRLIQWCEGMDNIKNNCEMVMFLFSENYEQVGGYWIIHWRNVEVFQLDNRNLWGKIG